MERWFAELTDKQIRRGSHRSTRALEDAIRLYLANHIADPKPFVWIKSADEIIDSIARFALRTSGTLDGCEAGHRLGRGLTADPAAIAAHHDVRAPARSVLHQCPLGSFPKRGLCPGMTEAVCVSIVIPLRRLSRRKTIWPPP